MLKPKLKINFTDFWGDFSKTENIFMGMLANVFEIEISNKPDISIYSCFGNDFLKYSCPKIYYTAENKRPDFKECDFAMTFDYGWPADKHYRLPLYRWNGDLEKLTAHRDAEAIIKQKTKFCCMVVSNANGAERNAFYQELNEYKNVDSGGKFLNNVGGPVENKMEFIKDYKFVLSFENSSFPGYTTEKIIEPMFAQSVPVYWGSNKIQEEFNDKSFINVHQYKSMNDAVEAIIKIDQDDLLYKQYLAAPFFNNNKLPAALDFENITSALVDAINRITTSTAIGNSNKAYSQRKIMKRRARNLLKKFLN